jgi:DNA-binding beta-propeller fold protein YncE
MKATIVGRLNLPEPSATVLIHGADLWIYGHQSRELRRFSGHREGSLRAAAPLQVQTPAKHGVSLSWDGANVLVADQVTRTVCRVDPNSGQQALVMDPQSLEFGAYDIALRGEATTIGDIAWHDGILYVSVQAGYSSAIYGIDVEHKRVVSHRFAPGPQPCGLDFDPRDSSMFTLDHRNRELRRYDAQGTMEIADLPVDLVDPQGLSFDSNRGLWCSDQASADLVHLNVEA